MAVEAAGGAENGKERLEECMSEGSDPLIDIRVTKLLFGECGRPAPGSPSGAIWLAVCWR
jgi:hypothetical protein